MINLELHAQFVLTLEDVHLYESTLVCRSVPRLVSVVAYLVSTPHVVYIIDALSSILSGTFLRLIQLLVSPSLPLVTTTEHLA
jgi:hypothetical protein